MAVGTEYTFTNGQSGQIVYPFGVIGILIQCWGGGGAGGSVTATGAGGGGKGGGYATIGYGSNGDDPFDNPMSDISHGIKPGGVLQINSGEGGNADGSGIGINGDPSEVIGTDKRTVFCRATGGNGVAVNTSTGQSTTNGTAVGDTIYTGGNGATTQNLADGGGGGEGACTTSNGQAGSGASGGSSCDGGDGGDGVVGGGAGSAGNVTGGGGGGAAYSRGSFYGGDGAHGKAIVTLYVENVVIAGMDEFL